MRRIISIIVFLAFISSNISFADTLRPPLIFSTQNRRRIKTMQDTLASNLTSTERPVLSSKLWLSDSISAMEDRHLKGFVEVQKSLASGQGMLVPEEIVGHAQLSDLSEMMALRKTYFFDEVIQDVKGSIFHLDDELDEKANADAVLHHCERIIRGHAPGSVMVARWRGEIIGYAIGWVPAVSAIEFGELAEMAVHKDYRRRGIAKALIKRVVTDMRSFATFSRINLHDFTKGEEKGSISRILEGLGFQSIEFGSYVLTLGKEEDRLNSVLARVGARIGGVSAGEYRSSL